MANNYYSYKSSELSDLDKRMRASIGLDPNTGMESESVDMFYTGFNRFGQIYPDREMPGLLSWVFIVRPDLNLISDDGTKLEQNYAAKDPYLQDLYIENPKLIEALTIEHFKSDHQFIPFLVDRVDSYQISDFSVKNYEVATTLATYKVSYGGNGNDSMSGDSFDITFREDVNLSLLKFFQAWVYYIHGVTRGSFRPKDVYIPNVMDYTTSIYYIVTGPDGSSIKYFHKRTGTFPYNVPHSNFSRSGNGPITDNKISISFAGSMPEPLNPLVLTEFNMNSHGAHNFGEIYDVTNEPYIPIYDNASDAFVSLSMVGSPFIVYDSKLKSYQLRWRPRAIN